MTDNIQQTQKYRFETDEFGINEEGIHLLRSRYNYESYLKNDIRKIAIAKGKEVNNWWALFMIGLSLLLGSLYSLFNFYNFLISDTGGKVYIEYIVALFVALITGVYFIYKSFSTGDQLFIENYEGKKKKLSMKPIIKKGEVEYKLFKRYIQQFQ